MAAPVKRRASPPHDARPSTVAPSSLPPPHPDPTSPPIERKRKPAGGLSALLILAGLAAIYFALQNTPLASFLPGNERALGATYLLDALFNYGANVQGHADFGDGRSTTCPKAFAKPSSEGLHWVNVNLGNGG